MSFKALRESEEAIRNSRGKMARRSEERVGLLENMLANVQSLMRKVEQSESREKDMAHRRDGLNTIEANLHEQRLSLDSREAAVEASDYTHDKYETLQEKNAALVNTIQIMEELAEGGDIHTKRAMRITLTEIKGAAANVDVDKK